MIAIGVVAHTTRLSQAEALADQVDADYMSVDDGTLGCDGNHRAVWAHLAHLGAEWSVVIEDDAIPVPDFRAQLGKVLAVSPSPVVSLYLGTARPVWIELAGRGSAQRAQPLVRQAVAEAEVKGASFITAPKLMHAVAVAIRTDLIAAMLDATAETLDPIDAAIGKWCSTVGHTVAYSYPSLVDHYDGPTVIRRHPDGEPRLEPRKAYKLGTRGTWTTRTVEIQ